MSSTFKPHETETCSKLVDGSMQPVGAVRNFILKRRSIIESYGGEIFGIGVEDTTPLRGFWSSQTTLIILSFDDVKGANDLFQILHLKTEFPQHVEYFTVNLSYPTKHVKDYPLIEISFYDVRYVQRFNWFIYQLPELACKHNGYLVAGTPKIIQKLGMSQPNYCSITQWKTVQEFKYFREQGRSMSKKPQLLAICLFEQSQSACLTEALVKLDVGTCGPFCS
ncbi:unnamed protein product [Hydatigera taeniaeformis]|uniref:DUF1330 domain-containing protein n=1 Tax=Hydatigena taeniaeformis TaxID=6205 RepID=A0A0R3X1K1_HYDTA|nr:unnamed protein product [Hydatigera taeniaeformis]